jgi:LAS superfamily LD-carboxypeptidase LdcB
MTKKELFKSQPILILFAILLGISIYEYVRIHVLAGDLKNLSEQVVTDEARNASTTAKLAADIKLSQASLAAALNAQTLDATKLQKQLQEQVGNVAGTVSTLQKLSQTDPQLLAKYSKVFFLNENYAPARLTEIPDEYKYTQGKAVSIESDVWPHLKKMIDDAKSENVALFVSSGYRSFAEQKNLKSDYRVTYGAGTANQFSADQGYSEHQLGTAVDFVTSNGNLDAFEGTTAQLWLMANAYRYGFILSYPKNNQYYQYEPWHWRFVGVKLATDLHNQGKNFYDLDQRDIDKYLVNIFE